MLNSGVKAVVVALMVLMGFYLGCFGFKLIAHGAYFACVMSMILLHFIGIDTKLLEALVIGADWLRSADYPMYAIGTLAAAGAATARPLLLQISIESKRALGVLAVTTVVFAGALAADLHYGISPVSELAYSGRSYDAGNLRVERGMTVKNLAYLEPAQYGILAETEGTLQFDERMKRFVLASPGTPRSTVYVFFFQHRRTLFSEMMINDKPRFYETGAPLIGRKVQLIGRCTNGHMDADVADIRAITKFKNDGNAQRPLTPL